MNTPVSLDTIASWVDGNMSSPCPVMVSGVADLRSATDQDISVYAHARWRDSARATSAAVVVCKAGFEADLPPTVVALLCSDPMQAWGTILRRFFPHPIIAPPDVGCHPSSVVHPDAEVHETACIGPLVNIDRGARILEHAVIAAGAHIGVNVTIGRKTTVMHRACVLAETQIGDACWIGPQSVIGSYGFGIDQSGRKPHPGTVLIGNRVTIGAQTCVDRATVGVTRVGDDCHIDNLVQVGHNVQIGRGVVICGQAGIAGSVHIGDGVVIGGQAGIADHIHVTAGCRIAAQSGVTRSLRAAGNYSGHPAEENRKRLRREAQLRKLADS